MSDLEEQVIEALRTCYDPEIPINIYDLGLVYEVKTNEASGEVAIKMTLTTPNCPVAGSLPAEVQRKARAVPGVKDATVELVWEPPWDQSKLSPAALLQLGLY